MVFLQTSIAMVFMSLTLTEKKNQSSSHTMSYHYERKYCKMLLLFPISPITWVSWIWIHVQHFHRVITPCYPNSQGHLISTPLGNVGCHLGVVTSPTVYAVTQTSQTLHFFYHWAFPNLHRVPCSNLPRLLNHQIRVEATTVFPRSAKYLVI